MQKVAHRLLLAIVLSVAQLGCAAAPKTKARESAAPDDAAAYATRQDVRDFAAEVAERRQLPAEWVLAQLAQARRQPTAQRLMMPPPAGTAKNWAAYRDRFVEAQRVMAGARFWQDNAGWLERAEQRYGVPAEIVVGIVGVETFYGRITGNFRVLDVLATLAFDFPPGRSDRSAFFRGELEEFLVMSRREGLEPAQPKGSFAGAMGLPQFMPSSFNRYAVDFDGDGRIDLTASAADVIGSVAHFLAAHGWQRGMPVTFEVAVPVDTRARATLLAPDIVPSFSAAQMAELGAELGGAARRYEGLLALVELQNGTGAPSYVAGTQNFYVLTRYNWSSYYAMAVLELGAAVRQQRAN
ncbi:MAG TPA: lytic murein transglycosylase B [Rubrivivax sp.]|nr:lytic murein transglycosylase B [Rubrivivax sp.]